MRRSALLATSTAFVAALGVGMPSAHAASHTYVALGDSYSAGVGTKSSDGTDCYRSQKGYAPLIAGQAGLTLSYQACSGATTADVTANQLGALTNSTAYVSMTIGGNDVGFSTTITECAKPAWLSDCAGSIAAGRKTLNDALPTRYSDLFSAIRSKAPSARVAIGGYPHIFMGEDCNAATFFSPDDEQGINTATDDLDSVVAGKARAAGFTYVDPRSSFTGHAVCDDVEWVNGLSSPTLESYHPNASGNVGYATLFAPALTGKAYHGTAARPTAVGPEARVRGQADGVLGMGLTTTGNLRRAKSAGLDPATVQRLVGRLRSANGTVVAQALGQLRALDRRAAATFAARR